MPATMTRHGVRLTPAGLNRLESDARAAGAAWVRSYEDVGPRRSRALAGLFQSLIWDLHAAGCEATAFDLANRARAMAREAGGPAW